MKIDGQCSSYTEISLKNKNKKPESQPPCSRPTRERGAWWSCANTMLLPRSGPGAYRSALEVPLCASRWKEDSQSKTEMAN